MVKKIVDIEIQQVGRYDRFKGSLRKGKNFSKKHKKKLATAIVISVLLGACATNTICAAQAGAIIAKIKAAAVAFPSAFGKFSTNIKEAANKGSKEVFKVLKKFLKSIKGKKPEVPISSSTENLLGDNVSGGFFSKISSGVFKTAGAVGGGLKFAQEAQQNIGMAKSLKSTVDSFDKVPESQPEIESESKSKSKSKSNSKSNSPSRKRRRRSNKRSKRRRPSRRRRKRSKRSKRSKRRRPSRRRSKRSKRRRY